MGTACAVAIEKDVFPLAVMARLKETAALVARLRSKNHVGICHRFQPMRGTNPAGMVSSQNLVEFTMDKKEVTRPDWFKLLETIIEEPGKLGDYYWAFRNYSLANQALAVAQLIERNVDIGPIASFNAWKKKGRSVVKGQKAIGLWMPITIKGKSSEEDEGSVVVQDGMPRRIFVMRNNWFSFAQTQPDPNADPSDAPAEEEKPNLDWNQSLALEALGISMKPFAHVNGNTQGFARPQLNEVAVSPVAPFPLKTLFHEMAHCLMHGDDMEFVCETDLNKAVKEVEAESVAYLCCAALSLSGLDEARGYIQHWLAHAPSRDVLTKSSGRIFSAADRILKAGLPQPQKAEVETASA